MCVGKTGENFSKIPAVIFSSGDINKGLLLLKISIPCKLSRKTVENILIRKKLCFANDLKKYFFLFSSVSLPFYLFRQPLHPLKDSQYQFQSKGGWVGRDIYFGDLRRNHPFPLAQLSQFPGAQFPFIVTRLSPLHFYPLPPGLVLSPFSRLSPSYSADLAQSLTFPALSQPFTCLEEF